MSFHCPTCGSDLSERPSPHRLVSTTPLLGNEMKVVHALLAEFGKPVARGRLKNRVFKAARRNSEARERALADAVGHANQKLSSRGLVIESIRGKPHCHRLTWLIEQVQCERCGALYPAAIGATLCICGGLLLPFPKVEETDQEAA